MFDKLQHLLSHKHRHWQEVDSAVYAAAYQLYGGSFLTHPLTVSTMSQMVEVTPHYFAQYADDVVLGAIPAWGSYLAGDKRFLKKIDRRRVYDTGNAEVILPLSSDHAFALKVKGQFISERHRANIQGLKIQPETLSFAHAFKQGGYSKKFHYNRRRELKLFQQAGGQITPFEELSSDRIAQAYIDLFELRWNKKPKGFERLTEFIGALRPLLKGHLLSIDEQPIAIQLIYVADNPALVSAEYVNGGVDLTFRQYSPGSILSYLNITLVEQIAEAAQKPFRYSFGLSDKDYKDSWCSPHPVYRT